MTTKLATALRTSRELWLTVRGRGDKLEACLLRCSTELAHGYGLELRDALLDLEADMMRRDAALGEHF